jgi:hypothetical protein
VLHIYIKASSSLLTFWSKILVSFPGSKSKKGSSSFGSFFYLEDGGNTFLQNTVDFYQTTWCHILEDSNLQREEACEDMNWSELAQGRVQ